MDMNSKFFSSQQWYTIFSSQQWYPRHFSSQEWGPRHCCPVINIVCCIFPASDVQGMILASSISFVGALVTECFTISKERKMMSFFHPERN